MTFCILFKRASRPFAGKKLTSLPFARLLLFFCVVYIVGLSHLDPVVQSIVVGREFIKSNNSHKISCSYIYAEKLCGAFFFFCRLLLPLRLHIFNHIPCIFRQSTFFFSYTICLSPASSVDVDMTVRLPKRTAPASLETNQSFLEDGAVTSLYHQTNNLGSLSFLFFLLFIYFFFAFLVKHIYTIQTNCVALFALQKLLIFLANTECQGH